MIVRTLKAAPALLRAGLADVVAYRAELVIWILSATMPVIMMLVWDAVAAGGAIEAAGGGTFDQATFARYFAASLLARQLTAAWVVWELNEEIRTGRLSPWLLKPVSPLAWYASENVAAMPFRAVVLVPILGVIVWWRPAAWAGVPWEALPWLALSLALGWGINFLVQVSFGSIAFLIDRSLGLWHIWFGLWSLLSGYLFPLALLPGWMAEAA